MQTNLLQIRNLQVTRGGKLALSVPQLDIPKGQITAILGPNGSGKSTLLLCVARLLKPSAGEIKFNGLPAKAEPDLSFRRKIGLVMQNPLLLDTTVLENVLTGLSFRGISTTEATRRAEIWLEKFNITHLKKRRANSLSGGEAQRVSLARAFVLEPQLLLLDEPFSALDAPTRARLLDDLHHQLTETQTTTLFVTHDLQEAKKIAEQTAVLLNGNLREFGPTEELFKWPNDPQVAEFVGK